MPPRVPSPGVLARTRGLITSHQFVQSLPEDAAQDLSLNLDDPTSGIVQVTRDQAIAFARFLTRDLQQQGVLRRNQYFRLPLRSETASQQIWRDEDVASINEARPFGLVLEEGP